MIRRFFHLFIVCAIVIAAIGASFVNDTFLISPKQNAVPIEIVVPQGASVSLIATQLQQAHLLAHPTFFKWFVSLTHATNSLQAGTFSFMPNSSIASLVLMLSNVKNAEVQVTIPEGFTNDQIKAKLVEAFSNFDVASWDTQTKELQGYLFPDTYRFSKNASVKEIVEKMQTTLDRRLLENGISMKDTALSFPDVLTMASIIEKEVKTPEDMKRVAGILFNRLKIGMPLQVDSTLTFVTQKSSANLTTADLKLASPYNTYTHKGLPPGPICNPGMNAILAVLHPTASNDLYFLTTNDGRTIFAKTHDEHVANKQRYLK